MRRSAGEPHRRRHAAARGRCGHPRLALGAIPQVLGLLGAILAGAAVLYALPLLSQPLDGIDPVFRPLVVLAALIGAVALGESVGANIGSSVARRLGNGLLGAADRTMGAGFGAVQALLIVWLAGSLLAEGPVPRLAETAGGSTAVRTMTAILPPPTEIAVGLGGWLDDRGLPDVFVGFEPLPGPPVDRPAIPPRGRSRRSPRRAPSRSRPPPAACRRSGPGSSSPMTTSSPTRTSWPGQAHAACG